MTIDQTIERYPLTWRKELLRLDVKLAALYRFYHGIAYELLPIETKKRELVEGGR
jgi:hypothetical protein